MGLYFGWKGPPGTWGVMSTLTLQYISRHKPCKPTEPGAESFGAFQFLDDGGFAEPALGLGPWIFVNLWEGAMGFSLGRRAVNLANRTAEGDFSTKGLMWGLLVDTHRGDKSP